MPTKKATAATPAIRPRKLPVGDAGKSPAELIEARIAELPAWQGALLARIRQVVRAADPEIVEEWKWNTPVWSCHGILCTGETYKKVVKLTFAKGASLDDPKRLFNSSLDGNTRRALDVAEGTDLDEPALKALVRRAVAFNKASAKKSPSR